MKDVSIPNVTRLGAERKSFGRTLLEGNDYVIRGIGPGQAVAISKIGQPPVMLEYSHTQNGNGHRNEVVMPLVRSKLQPVLKTATTD